MGTLKTFQIVSGPDGKTLFDALAYERLELFELTNGSESRQVECRIVSIVRSPLYEEKGWVRIKIQVQEGKRIRSYTFEYYPMFQQETECVEPID